MRLYALLLRLYPSSFRSEYGGEMSRIFRLRRERVRGAWPVAALWAATLRETVTTAPAVHWDILRQDLRYTARTLGRAPGFTLAAILVVALGVGANTAVFSVADFVFLRPLPYPEGDRLVKLWEAPPDFDRLEVAPPNYRDWKASASSFDAMGAWYDTAVNVAGYGEPVRVPAAGVSADLLPILRVSPLLGRLFDPADEREGRSDGVILAYGLWQAQFGGDPGIVGRRVLVDGVPRDVTGVMPRGFDFPTREIGLWLPMNREELTNEERGNNYWDVLGRLAPGVTLDQARADMAVIARRLQLQHPDELEGMGISVFLLRDEYPRQARLLLLALCGAAACVLLAACANLASLLLARGLARRGEIAIRSALGAGRERLVRQLVTESLLLAVLGGALGVALAGAAFPLLARFVPTSLPIAGTPSVDLRVLVLAALSAALTGLGFGVLPAWRAARADAGALADAGRGGGGRRERARSALVVAEVMASVVLLVSGGLLLRALWHLQQTDSGFEPRNVLTLRTALSPARYDTTLRRADFYREVLRDVRSLPGVTGAAYITGLPMDMGGGIWQVTIPGEPQRRVDAKAASSRYVTPGYFTSLGIPILRGRDVSDADTSLRPPVAVVSESFGARFMPGRDPLGQPFTFGPAGTRTVVGIVRDVRVRGPERASEPQVYLPHQQVEDGQSIFYHPRDLVIRSPLPVDVLLPRVREIVRRVDPQQPISSVRMLSEVVSAQTATRALQVRVLGAFAAVALLLAAVGIHGLLSFAVSARRREIAVRMALGAGRGGIVRMVMSRALLLAAAGVIPGIALAAAAATAMRSLLAGVRPGDLATFSAAVVLCTVMTLAGSLVPALRAVRVDPAASLRAE